MRYIDCEKSSTMIRTTSSHRSSSANYVWILVPMTQQACRRLCAWEKGRKTKRMCMTPCRCTTPRRWRCSACRKPPGTTLTIALRRIKDRSSHFLLALRYERARMYEEQGQPAMARADYEKIYVKDPDYEGVTTKLWLRKTNSVQNQGPT